MALTKLNTLSLADDAITSAKIADDAVVAAAIADNAVVTAAIADDAVTSAKTTVTSTNPNILINGDMAIAQRATSSTVTGIKTVDRWSAAWGGGGGITQSQVALTSGGAYDEGHRHAFKMAVTSTNSANGRYAQVNYKVESQQIRNSGWQYNSASSYVTISFWAKASLAGTYWLSFYCPDTNTQYYSTSFALSAATWTKITKTFPGGSNITFNDDTGNGLQIDIYLDYGTDLTASDATLNSWHTFASGKYMTDFAQSWFNTGSATFEVTGCKLEVGQSATTFEKPDYTTEFKKCQRYYWVIRGDDGPDYSANYGFVIQWSSSRFSGWNPFFPVVYPAEMRGIPTFSVTGTLASSNGGTLNCTGYRTRTQCGLGMTGTTATSGSYWNMNSTDDRIQWDAEL
tara:strand:+ start:304 stop:1503 length:1200 start_codon:yes stop_codon:yes gene_type:complete